MAQLQQKETEMNTIVKDSSIMPLELLHRLHNINSDILVTSAFLRAITNIGEVILDSMPQSIVSILARSAGAEVTYAANQDLSQRRGSSFFHAFIESGVEPVSLSHEEYDLTISPRVEAGFEDLSEQCVTLRVRTPDSFLSGRVKVSWLAFRVLYEALLCNSESVVSSHRPLISGFVNKEDIAQVNAWAQRFNYRAVTSGLDLLGEKEGYCWLVPNEGLLESVRESLGIHKPAVNANLSLTKIGEQLWPSLLCGNDSLAKQTRDFFINQRRWYFLDRLINIGLNPIETDGKHYWRWIGEKGVRLFLPLRASGHYTVSFSVFSIVDGLDTVTIRCFINGALRATEHVVRGSVVQIPYYEQQDGGMAELFIVSEQSIAKDGKVLSISISELTVNWGDM